MLRPLVAVWLLIASLQRAAAQAQLEPSVPAEDWVHLVPAGVTLSAVWDAIGMQPPPQNASIRSGQEKEVLECWNGALPDRTTTWEVALGDRVVNTTLKIAAAWWSTSGDANTWPVQATVATSGTLDRLGQLHSQCVSWLGPLSAAIYVPLVSEPGTDGVLSASHQTALRSAAARITHMLANLPASACKLDIVLLWELLEDEDAASALLPFNLPRNLARLQVRTEMVAELDIDLLTSSTLKPRVQADNKLPQLLALAKQKTAFILPAFDIESRLEHAHWAEAVTAADKEVAAFAQRKGYIYQFHVNQHPPGHAMTNYTAWQDASTDYEVKHEQWSEPWLMGARRLLPWHDSRYRSWYLNKIQYVQSVATSGFKFVVLHDVFIVHRPHKTRKQPQPRNTTRPAGNNSGAMLDAQTKEGSAFVPWLNAAVLACRGSLSWWRD